MNLDTNNTDADAIAIGNEMTANICEALAYQKNIRLDIDKLYKYNKYRAYEAAKVSEIYNHGLFFQGDLEKEIYCKRVLGLFLLGEVDASIRSELVNIIRKNLPKLFHAVRSKQPMALTKHILEVELSELPAVSKSEKFLALYLVTSSMTSLGFYDEGHAHYMAYMMQVMQGIGSSSSIYKCKDDLISNSRDKIESIYHRISKKRGTYSSYENLYGCQDEEINKYQTIISLIFDLEGLSISNTLNSVELDKKDIEEIILAYTMVYNDKNLDRSTNVLVNGIMIKSLIKAYKEVKKSYFQNNKETLFLDLESLENKIKDSTSKNLIANQKIDTLSQQVKNHSSTMENEIKRVKQGYNKELTVLNKRIKEIEQQLEEEKSNKIELDELREMLFSIENDHTVVIDDQNLEEIIGDKKILVVGGTPEWRKRLKEKYPMITTLDGFTETFDKQFLKDLDFVFFYVGYMNHGTYFKVVNVLKSIGIPFKYIGKTNIELVESEMSEGLQNVRNRNK